jgi:hypothetical protein
MRAILLAVAVTSLATPAFACRSDAQCAASPGYYCDLGAHPGGEGQCRPGSGGGGGGGGGVPASPGICYADSNCQVPLMSDVPYYACSGSSWSPGDGFCYSL